MKLSSNIERLQPSATIALASRCRELQAAGRDVLNLSVGEPDFDTPAFITDAAVRALREGQTRYTASAGIPALRAAIARELHRLSPSRPAPDAAGIVVTSGAKQALFNACFALFGPGDRVLVPVPYWTTYPALVELARAEPVFVAGDPDRGYKLTPDDLERAAGGRAAGLLLNSPGNPAGTVYTLEELDAIARWAAERGVWLVSDEIYRLVYRGGQPAPGLLDLDPSLLERTVVIDGASKAFAMTGWRIGFSYSDTALAARMTALQSQTVSQAATPSQHAALAAYGASDEQRAEIEAMMAAFERRRARVVSLFREHLPRVGFIEPEGAFYLFFEVAAFARAGASSDSVCERILEEAGVAVVPGSAFGDDAYARLSYACSEADLEEGVARLARLLG
jgi:aspartate aminotransferase